MYEKAEIIPFDLKRMLFGQAPPEFLAEVLIRTLIVHLIGIVVLRLLSKRMNGQLSILEMAGKIISSSKALSACIFLAQANALR